jgi:hypothetical protein
MTTALALFEARRESYALAELRLEIVNESGIGRAIELIEVG